MKRIATICLLPEPAIGDTFLVPASERTISEQILCKMNNTTQQIKIIGLTTLVTIAAANCFAADAVIVESRTADGARNPVWTELSGKWDDSKNKSRVSRTTKLAATNVSICTTNVPAPAFKVMPSGLAAGQTYQVEVTFSTSSTHGAASDLIVAIAAEGVSASTIPTNSPAFQNTGADRWTTLGNITTATATPTLTFTYVSGTLTKESRWYADAIRFTPVTAAKASE